jgi:hypothetical protein
MNSSDADAGPQSAVGRAVLSGHVGGMPPQAA